MVQQERRIPQNLGISCGNSFCNGQGQRMACPFSRNHVTGIFMKNKIAFRLSLTLLVLAGFAYFGMFPWLQKHRIKRELAARQIDCTSDGMIQAIRKSDLDAVTKLLHWGIAANDKSSLNEIPVMEAAKRGDVPILKVLLDHGADTETIDFKERTVLWHLAHAPYTDQVYEGVIALIQKGAHLERTYPDQWNPLIWASKKGSTKVVELLLLEGADVNTVDPMGMTALMYAVKRGQLDLTQLLLNSGSNLSLKDGKGRPLLYQASQSSRRNFKVVAALIDHGIDVKGPFPKNWCPLRWASFYGNTKLVAHCLSEGLDPNAADSMGFTALMIAAQNNHLETAKLLIEAGGRTDLKNHAGQTVADLVKVPGPAWDALLQ
ncbi:MAG: hypothetical protein CR997_11575 [Acidobacteria bacterium]|nr:MAG: hypothetical protein CR997_11575 [Acidobacteriota bacterium]